MKREKGDIQRMIKTVEEVEETQIIDKPSSPHADVEDDPQSDPIKRKYG